MLLIERILDDVLIARNEALLRIVGPAVVLLYGANGALGLARGLLTRRVSWQVISSLRSRLFASLLRQDVGFHQRASPGALVSRLTQDVENVQYGVSAVVTAIQKPLTLVGLVVAAASMNPRLTLVAVLALPLVAWPIRAFGRRLRARTAEGLDSLAALSGLATESLGGIRSLQRDGAETWRQRAFDAENQRQEQLRLQAILARLLPSPVVELIAALGVAAVIYVGGQQVFAGELEPGALIAFLVALGLLNAPLKGLSEIQSLSQRAIAGAEAVYAVLDRPSALPDTGSRVLDVPHAALEFRGVHFSYGDEDVLCGLDLTVEPGRVVALVGASGAGKSTAANLACRLLDPTAGSVRLGGFDLRDCTLSSVRRHIAVVAQEPFLFDDTVAANISLGRPEVSRVDIEAAAKVANAHAFIAALPQGYDTPVNGQGLRLSGGQRQRICIARAVLRDAPVLVLDEATSALDAESEHLVQEALDRLGRDRAVLAIAHRLSTIRGADEILVLDQGRVVERGQHADLMARGGVYAALVGRQGG